MILENHQMEKIAQKVAFSFWEKLDEEHTVVRFATGWSTTDEDLKALGCKNLVHEFYAFKKEKKD